MSSLVELRRFTKEGIAPWYTTTDVYRDASAERLVRTQTVSNCRIQGIITMVWVNEKEKDMGNPMSTYVPAIGVHLALTRTPQSEGQHQP